MTLRPRQPKRFINGLNNVESTRHGKFFRAKLAETALGIDND
jgi:hypothetical protein